MEDWKVCLRLERTRRHLAEWTDWMHVDRPLTDDERVHKVDDAWCDVCQPGVVKPGTRRVPAWGPKDPPLAVDEPGLLPNGFGDVRELLAL